MKTQLAMTDYHVPIMLAECVDGLAIRPDGVYVDLTFGGGGHSRGILEHLPSGKLYGFDQDPDTQANIAGLDRDRFEWIQANFRFAKKFLKLHGVTQVDGIMADLGISSHQIDQAERGFSTRLDGPLDMRMDQSGDLSAASVVNEYAEAELIRVLRTYGELRNAKGIAQEIIRMRASGQIESTKQLGDGLVKYAPDHRHAKFLAQIFQAIRIEVNDELGALKEMLQDTTKLLKPGGRLVILTFHSLEDRLVKQYMKAGNFSGEAEKDFYGNPLVPFVPITRKPITANQQEMAANGRARSAKLRVAERTDKAE